MRKNNMYKHKRHVMLEAHQFCCRIAMTSVKLHLVFNDVDE